MPVKTFGIYLAYAPTVDLKYQGLGRYLALFLKAAANRSDVRFVIACPSWLKDPLIELCRSEGVPIDSFSLMTPSSRPALLRIYEAYMRYRRRLGRGSLFARLRERLALVAASHRRMVEKELSTTRSLTYIVLLFIYILVLGIVAFPFVLIGGIGAEFAGVLRRLIGHAVFSRVLTRLSTIVDSPKESQLVLRLNRFMDETEAEILTNLINRRKDVQAWYCPTAFWPSFNDINKTKIMCVPDVVLRDFPVGFSRVGGDRFLESFQRVEHAIRGGTHFITYSEDVKWLTLVDRYGIAPEDIHVIPHATSNLGPLIDVQGFANNEISGRRYAEALMSSALQKMTNLAYGATFANRAFQFLFYPSQFRPSKNIVNLLRAYSYLLRESNLSHKLVLTGNPKDVPEIDEFISQNNLSNDVICLRGLSLPELAACYRLADLAINPSFSEGGCPFTFAEAVSVGTPVVMARIAVAEEVIKDDSLRATMFFDPFSWRDMADRIRWALEHRRELLSEQIELFTKLSERTWDTVVDEHISILSELSSTGGQYDG